MWTNQITTQSQNCDEVGTITRESYFSVAVGQTMFYSVYTPPCYTPDGDPLPVIYLMHGSNDDDGQWARLGLQQLLDERILSSDMPPIAVVMPFGNVIANRNRFDQFSWRETFLNELMPHAEERYAISTEREMRAIGGISRGGFWAYQIALSNPDMFNAVGGHSAFFDLYHAAPEVNPLDLALTSPAIDDLRLWLDRGMDDFAADGLEIMADRLTQRGVDFAYTVHPIGEHNNAYWSQHIGEYLDFYVADWLNSEETGIQQPAFFATNTPSAPIEIQALSDDELLLPVVAFASLETSITSEALQTIADGIYSDNLVLTPEVAATIGAHPDTRLIAADQLRNHLWQNRTRFTLLPLNQLTIQYRILLVDELPITSQLDRYPFAGGTSSLTRFTLSGVTALTRNTRTVISDNSINWVTEAIQPYVTHSDVFHMSHEVSFSERCPNLTGDLLGGSSSFCAFEDQFELFNLLEVDVVELTGNHNNDYGYDDYASTLAWYQNNQIPVVGGGATLADARSPYIVTHNGNTIALIACNAVGPYYALVNEDDSVLGGVRGGAAPCDMNWLELTLSELSEQVDVVIVSVQYQEVEDYLPLASQQIDFRQIANFGADVVIGSQAHKPQTFEFYPTQRGETAFIHYGLGNFYFDQPFWGNMRFFLDTLYISDGELRSIELFPGIIDELARPRLMTAGERQNFMFFMLVEQNGL